MGCTWTLPVKGCRHCPLNHGTCRHPLARDEDDESRDHSRVSLDAYEKSDPGSAGLHPGWCPLQHENVKIVLSPEGS